MPTNQTSESVVALISQIQSEAASKQMRERRMESRQHIVIPVAVQFLDRGTETLAAVSRDISTSGICLITTESIDTDKMGVLSFERQFEETSEVYAQCCWSEPFGNGHWISGWQYLPKTI